MQDMCSEWLRNYDEYQAAIQADTRPIVRIDALNEWMRDSFSHK